MPNDIIKSINNKAILLSHPVRLMELCGTHSQTVAINGIKSLIPENVKLVSGPGCPVCVTDQSDIDIVVGLALYGIPIAAYGDVVNVPGNLMSLEEARRNGADVNIVYDTAEAVQLKKKKPRLVFFGIGFETTTPMTAWAIKNGLTVYSAHKLFPPAMSALLRATARVAPTSSYSISLHNRMTAISPSLRNTRDINVGAGLASAHLGIDGFINPGHVSAIIGTEIYKKFKVPQVIAGFEGLDVLKAVDMLLGQIINKKAKVENEYSRVVKKEGNKKAQNLINEVFKIKDAKWRGLGEIKKSGLKIRTKYKERDAEYVYKDLIKKIKNEIKPKPSACKCGLVLQGLIEPRECPLFKKVCSPDNPQGACMVSVEGACNVEFRYS
ncbi:hydrogenase formation protein HypD [Candidatus Falkowbacteria bacterium]|nr:hydrogenase formation protein HypD [Candidatus Falkowbacteria bacterium]